MPTQLRLFNAAEDFNIALVFISRKHENDYHVFGPLSVFKISIDEVQISVKSISSKLPITICYPMSLGNRKGRKIVSDTEDSDAIAVEDEEDSDTLSDQADDTDDSFVDKDSTQDNFIE